MTTRSGVRTRPFATIVVTREVHLVIFGQVIYSERRAKLSKIDLKNAMKRKALKEADKSANEATSVTTWPQKANRVIRLTKIAYFVFGVVIGLAIDALSIPKSIVEFKSHIAEARRYVSDLVYRTDIWPGIFDTFPEGIVNMNDLEISSIVDAALEIEVVEGNRLDGRVWWEKSCELGSPYQGLLLEGYIRIGGASADVKIFDFLGGQRVDFFSGRLENDGLLVYFSEFPPLSGLNGSNIARNPEPAELENWQEMHCEWFSEAIQDLNDQE